MRKEIWAVILVAIVVIAALAVEAWYFNGIIVDQKDKIDTLQSTVDQLQELSGINMSTYLAAKEEGKVVFYTAASFPAPKTLADAFTAKYGIEVEIFRSGTYGVLERFLGEAQAGKTEADVLAITEVGSLYSLIADGYIEPYLSPHAEHYPDAVKDSDGYWVICRTNLCIIAVNTDFISVDDAPKTWLDLKDPQYKGKIVMPDPTYGGTSAAWLYVLVYQKNYGWEFVEDVVANDVLRVKATGDAIRLVETGERPIGAYNLDMRVWSRKLEGIPLENIIPEDTGVIPMLNPASLVKNAPHPNAAKLFIDFLLSIEGQEAYNSEQGTHSWHEDWIALPAQLDLKTLNVTYVDYYSLKDKVSEVQDKFVEIVGG